MEFEVFSLDNSEGRLRYNDLVNNTGMVPPHFLPGYFEIFCSGFTDLLVFSFINDDQSGTIFMPGYYRSISVFNKKTDYFDFITPYGYTGPVFLGKISEENIKRFWTLVDQWHNDHMVVSEFIRFNLFGNHIFYTGEVFPTLLNIKGLILTEQDQWTSFEHKVRKNVNRAKKELVMAKVYYQNIEEAEIRNFYEIYIDTMIRTNASQVFFYKLSDFTYFINRNKSATAICTAYYVDKAISSELVLVSGEAIYSFLGGTKAEYFEKRPNDLLKSELISWARTKGIKYFILGGGYGEEDGIFKYKKSFFPNDVVSFKTGRKILNNKNYERLIGMSNVLRKDIGLTELDSSDNSFFPLYRKQN